MVLLTGCSLVLGQPNIVLIVADDLGFSDLGCYGSEIRTPVLDGLSKEGVRLSQFYNAARCCPSRACLLTGRYPHQVGLGHMTYDAGVPGYRGELRNGVLTIAEILKKAGYTTAMSGKWHVTPNTAPNSPRNNWPCQRGFDEFFGTLPGHGSLWDPKGLYRNNNPMRPGKVFFYTDAIADHAVQFIKAAREVPLFLYVAFTAPHYPLHARESTIASYEGVYDVGWDEIRKRRLGRLIDEGLLPKNTILGPRDPASVPWEEEQRKKWQAHRMQVYAAMVTEMDAAIGRILTALDQDERETLIVFVSDNGGSNEGHLNNTIERMKKPWTSSLIPKKTPGGTPVRAGDWPGERLGGPATYGSYGPRWASVSNTPFRRHKSWVHEGGIASPCIIKMPGSSGPRGTISQHSAHLIDLLPTFVKLAGGNEAQQFEGRDIIAPILELKRVVRELGWEHEGNRAYRIGGWKLVSEYPGTWVTMYPYGKKGEWELYDLAQDRTELNDLAEKEPAKLKEMITAYEKWAERVGVVPWSQLEGRRE